MPRMVPHPRVLFDDGGNARQRPQIGAEAVGPCALAKQVDDLFELVAVELGLAPGPTGGTEGGQPAPLPGLVPATGTLPAHVEHPSDEGQSLARTKQLSGLLSPLF